MHAVIRTYSGAGAKKLVGEFEKHKKDIEQALGAVKGLVSYSLINTGSGGVSVTVCRDKAGADESVRIAGDWIKKNVPSASSTPPTVTEGTVVVHL